MLKLISYSICRHLLTFLLSFCAVSTIYGQETACTATCECEIEGLVVDQITGEPLPYASVSVIGTNNGTYSDDKGVFHLHGLCVDEFDLKVTYVGYKSVTHHHDTYHEAPIIYLAPTDFQLESVVVEGKRNESDLISVTELRIRPEDLENSRTESLGDVLSNLTGVTTLKTGQNVVKPVVHGLHSNRVLIINNGVRHENQNWGIEHAPEIDPSQVEEITLVKGAAAVRYGSDALGGVIITHPTQPKLSAPLRGNLELTGKSNGRSVGNTISLQQGNSRFAWTSQVSGLYQGDLHTPDYLLTNTSARELSFGAGIRYHQKNLDLNVFYSNFSQELGILRGSVVGNLNDLANAIGNEPPAFTSDFSYTIQNPRQYTNHQLLKFNGIYNFSSHSILDLQYGFQMNKRLEFDIRRGTNNERPSINLELTSHTFDGNWKHPATGPFRGSVGVQWLYQHNSNIAGTNTIPYIPNFSNTKAGLYLIESTEFGNIIAEAGLRYDVQFASVRGRDAGNEVFRNTFNYQNFTGTLGIYTPLSAYSSLRSSLGTAWRPPNISELYSFGKHEYILEYGLWRYFEGETDIFTDEDRPVNSEMGLKWVNTLNYQKNNVALELTTHANYLQNYIYTRPAGITTTVRGAFPFFIHDQTDALFAGLDGSLIYDHSGSWQSQLKMSLLTARDLRSDEFFVGTPANRLTYSLRYFTNRLWQLKNLSAGIRNEYSFRQFQAPDVLTVQEIQDAKEKSSGTFTPDNQSFDFLPAPKGYYLLHLYTSFATGKFTYRLQVRNVLNTAFRDYTDRLRYFADDTGRNFILTIKYAF